MATFVLVHGAWHGGWCWRDVRSILRAGGHEVFTPTLTGLGRALASAVPRHRHEHPRRRRRQHDRLGGAPRRRPGRSLIRRQRDHRRRRPHEGPAGARGLSRRLRAGGRRQLRLHGGDRRQPPTRPMRISARRSSAASTSPESAAVPGRTTPICSISPKTRQSPYRWVERRITPHPVRTQIEPIRLENGGSDGPAAHLYPVHRLGRTGALQGPREADPERSHVAFPGISNRARCDGHHAGGDRRAADRGGGELTGCKTDDTPARRRDRRCDQGGGGRPCRGAARHRHQHRHPVAAGGGPPASA